MAMPFHRPGSPIAFAMSCLVPHQKWPITIPITNSQTGSKASQMNSEKMKFTENHLVIIFVVSFETLKVGMTGFEPATTRTPCVYATRLRHIP